jgi:hypothetical protein
LLSETAAQLVVTEKKVKRDRRTDSQQPRKHRKSKCFLILIFLPRSAAAAILANNRLRTAKIRKYSSRVMAGHQARSAVFAHNVPAIPVFCFTAK